MSKPILALIPSGYKGGTNPTVYSILPNNGDGDFDFDRASEGTRVRKDGLIEEVTNDVPRLDWLNSNCPSLLLEPERTNYATNNKNMDTYSALGGSSSTSPTLTANYTIAPDGTLTATRLQTTTTGTNYSLLQFPTTTLGNGDYTCSVYVKSNTGANQTIAFYGQLSSPNTRVATTEWTRVEFTGNRGTGLTKYAYLGTWASSLGTDAVLDISIWGAQIEVDSSYASSLIITPTGSAVTRLKDTCTLLNQTLFTNYPYTVYVKAKVDNFSNVAFSLIDSVASNKYLSIQFTSSTQIGVLRRDASNNDSDYYTYSYSIGDTLKIAISYVSDTSYKLYVNGTELADITSGLSIPFDHNDISLGQFRIASDTGTRNSIDDFRVYDYTLTDTQLTELTTL